MGDADKTLPKGHVVALVYPVIQCKRLTKMRMQAFFVALRVTASKCNQM
jgi:hypothetical protein